MVQLKALPANCEVYLPWLHFARHLQPCAHPICAQEAVELVAARLKRCKLEVSRPQPPLSQLLASLLLGTIPFIGQNPNSLPTGEFRFFPVKIEIEAQKCAQLQDGELLLLLLLFRKCCTYLLLLMRELHGISQGALLIRGAAVEGQDPVLSFHRGFKAFVRVHRAGCGPLGG